MTPGFSYATLTLTVLFRTYPSIKITVHAILPTSVLQAAFFCSVTSENLAAFLSMMYKTNSVKLAVQKVNTALAINHMNFQGIPARLEQSVS